MKRTRTKRAPKISTEQLNSGKQEKLGDIDLEQLSARLINLEKLRQDKLLNTPFIALEALSALAGAILAGKSEEELRNTWPGHWGDAAISVPLPLVLALREAWSSYRAQDSSQSLGEAFRIEGRGQGKTPMKNALSSLDAMRGNANHVEATYLASNAGEAGLSLEQVIEEISEVQGLSPVTVKKHHQEFKKEIRQKLANKGLLKGS